MKVANFFISGCKAFVRRNSSAFSLFALSVLAPTEFWDGAGLDSYSPDIGFFSQFVSAMLTSIAIKPDIAFFISLNSKWTRLGAITDLKTSKENSGTSQSECLFLKRGS